MAKLKKLNPEDIVDTLHVREISEETGEILEYSKSVYSAEGSSKIIDNKRYKISENELHQYINEEFGRFFFYMYSNIDDYDLQPQYKTRVLVLASYLDYNSNVLVEKSERNINLKLNKDNIKDILKLSDSEFRKTMKALTDSGVVIKDDKNYILNNCFKRGNLKSKSVLCTRVFVKSIRDLYWSTEAKNHKQLYYLFKMLPYTNMQFNIPCKNINCENIDSIDPLTMNDISSLLGYGDNNGGKLWKVLRGFKINGNYAVCKFSFDEDKEYITINPRLYYAGTQIENVTYIINIFDMAK